MNVLNTAFTFFSDIEWQQPWWLLLALQPLLLWLILRLLSKRSQLQFADEHLLPWVKVKTNKTIWQRIISRDTAYFLAWVGFALALANPQIPDRKTSDPSNTNMDVMLVIDLSRSMYATDIKPSRLRRATLEAYELLSLAKNTRVGIVVYAARAHLFVPLTSDFNALKFYLKDLDSLQLPTLGSNAESALLLAQKKLMQTSSVNKNIVWITDADIDDEQLKAVDRSIQHKVINSSILGIATKTGAAIPLADGSWLETNGQAIISKPNFEALRQMAKKGGGVLSLVEDDESDWQKIYQQGILKSTNLKGIEDQKQLKTIYQWFLFPAFVFLFIALFFRFLPSFKATFFIAVVFGLIAFNTIKAEDSFLNRIQQGADAYKKEEFSFARNEFIQAVLKAGSDKERAIALHNLGNSLFQDGDYETANKLFTDALRYNSDQTQSSNNQQLSDELFKIIEIRKRKAMMRGNLSAPNQNSLLFDLPKKFSSTLSTKAINTTKLKLPDLPKADLDKLLKKGLDYIQLLQSETQLNVQQKQQELDVNTARQQLIELGEQGTVPSNALWKRLFEIEEGFAGSLKAPEKLPGVKPW